METKCLNLDKHVYKDMLKRLVLPKIMEVWPEKNAPIFVQDDNAPAHGGALEEVIKDHHETFAWPMQVRRQPPNSPDLNVLDLGYFRSLQTEHYKNSSTCLDSLIASVEVSYQKLDPVVLDNSFRTLCSVMESTMKCGGGNNFKIPHQNKARLRSLDMLPETIECSREVVEACDVALGQIVLL